MAWTSAIIDVLAPGTCPACDGPCGVTGRTILCPACARLVPHMPRAIAIAPPVRGAWVLGSHEGPLGAMVRRGKYRPAIGVMDELGQRLADAADGRLPRIDRVTHVPVPWQRRMTRGFDQAEVLARATARRLGVPHIPMLRRVGSEEQAGRSVLERRAVGRGAFRCHVPATGQRVLLVDDVVTTGTTATTCATELLGDGATCVYVLAVTAPNATLLAPFRTPTALDPGQAAAPLCSDRAREHIWRSDAQDRTRDEPLVCDPLRSRCRG